MKSTRYKLSFFLKFSLFSQLQDFSFFLPFFGEFLRIFEDVQQLNVEEGNLDIKQASGRSTFARPNEDELFIRISQILFYGQTLRPRGIWPERFLWPDFIFYIFRLGT